MMALFYLYIFDKDGKEYNVYAPSEREAQAQFKEETGLNQKPTRREPW